MQNTDKESSHLQLGRIVISLSAITIIAKVFGFAEKIVIAHFFGTDIESDVYFASMGLVLSATFMVRELIYPSLLPVLSKAIHEQDGAVSNLLRKIFICAASILLILCCVLFMFSGLFTAILLPGFKGEKFFLTSKILQFLSPAIFFLSLSMITQTVLNSYKKFIKAAVPETVMKIFIVAGIIVLAPFIGIYAVAAVLVLCSAMLLAAQFYCIPEKIFIKNHGPCKDFNDVLRLMSPIAIGIGFSHISGIVDNMLASGLGTGSVSYLGYSKKIIDAIILIGPVAIITVAYSQLCHLASLKKWYDFKKLFAKALTLILSISIPASLVLMMFSKFIVAILFQRGKFSAISTAETSDALFVYAIGLVVLSIEGLVVYSFFAISDTKTPVKWGIVCVCIDIALAILLIGPLGFTAIAWAFVISKTIKVAILFVIIKLKLTSLSTRNQI